MEQKLRNFKGYVSYDHAYAKKYLALPEWCNYMEEILPNKVTFFGLRSEMPIQKLVPPWRDKIIFLYNRKEYAPEIDRRCSIL